MNETISLRSCPGCRQPLPLDAPDGLCPECLLLKGLETPPGAPSGPGSAGGHLPEPGGVFGGYRIERELGRGGMGAVFEAEELETGRRVALKVLNHQLDSPQARARFLREGRLAASINHPNSVYVYGTEEIDGMPAIVMELVAGGVTLQERVKRDGMLPVGEAVDVILQVIAGLEAAQAKGILHRDVKPANCFEDAAGVVKVGDFGLSISTEARGETQLTLDGAVFGTPAFASPEQLRGDELNARSDIYSVGVTLFFLLTGRLPFEGKTVAQLFASVLENAPRSPKEFREAIPSSLVKVVMRCLEKTPGERYRDYGELRGELEPFSSEAPVPAGIAIRSAAGLIDWLLASAAGMVGQLLLWGDQWSNDSAKPVEHPEFTLLIFGGFAGWVLYFAVLEGAWGASIGKAICRIRVCGADRSPPGFPRALVRAALFLVVPVLPLWIYHGFDTFEFLSSMSDPRTQVLRYTYYVIAALFFVTARRRNGLAAVHDLVSGTRVIRKSVFARRLVLPAEAAAAVTMLDEGARIGPFHVLEELDVSGGWLLGYDARLLRKVWIRVVPPGTPPLVPALRKLGRVGRLRWIAGRRGTEENWDAFEAPGGKALVQLLAGDGGRQPWQRVRFWLLDLAEETDAAILDGTLPDHLGIDRVWINAEGRAKLLDFPVPGNAATAADPGRCDSVNDFFRRIANTAADPLPLHAAGFKRQLPALGKPGAVAGALRPLTRKLTTVSRARRALLVACSLAFPVLAGLGFLLSSRMVENWNRQQPEITKLHQILSYRGMARFPFMKNQNPPDDRFFAIYIAANYRELIADSAQWKSLYALSVIAGEKRRFAEQSVANYPEPSASEIREAEAAVGPRVLGTDEIFVIRPGFALMVAASSLLIYVAVPAMIAALISRGGLVMLLCGVAVVRRDGVRPSRWRALWRSLVAWLPVLVAAPVLMAAAMEPQPGVTLAGGIATVLALLFVGISLGLPGRSLQDRVAGTVLVPR